MAALSGLKLVDFGAFIAGPYAARILGDLGATVIKVEPPGGETMRPKDERIFSSHKGQNVVTRGTRDIVVDLKTEEGRSIVHKLISDADVVSQNMRPGVAERLGIGYQDVKRINPSAIYLFSPGFGSTGPRSHLPSFEPLNSAFVGIHYRTGGEGNSPIQSMSLDGFCGLLAACGVMMALLHRQKTGEGQYMDVSQLASAMYYTSDTYKTSVGVVAPLPDLDKEQSGTSALNRLYQTKDDWICIACEKDFEWKSLCIALGIESLVDEQGFQTEKERYAHRDELEEILSKIFQLKTSDDWFQLLDQSHVPCEIPVMDGEERFLHTSAFVASGLVAEYDHPLWGLMREIGSVINFSETPGRIFGPPSRLGQHTYEIMSELGYGSDDVKRLEDEGVIYASPKP